MAELTIDHSPGLASIMPAGMLNMFVLGASTTLYGPSLVYISEETGQPAAALGVMFALHWAGFFASTFSANRLARRLEMRRATMLGVTLIALGVLGLILLPFPLNIAAVFLVGLGNGTSEVLFNRLAELLSGHKPAEALSRLHSTWGVGAVAIPLVVAGAVVLGWNWRWAGVFVILVALVDFLLIARWREFRVPHGEGIHWRALPWRSIALFLALFATYIGAETAVGAWVATYFAQLGQGALVGAFATSLFFLTFSFGRIVLASATDRVGFGRTVRISTVAAACALTLTLVPSLALVGFALAGVAMSLVFPTLLAWAPRRHPQIRAQMMSLGLASTGVGGIIAPFAIGIGVGILGVWALAPMLIGVLLTVTALSFLERDPSARAAP